MKDFLSKLSSYNLFNYLFPGVVFTALASWFTQYDFTQSDAIAGAFVYYFIGLVVSRFGSLVLEPFLKKISFLKFADYKDFVLVSDKDDKLDILSEQNNTYRTLSSLCILLLLLKLYELIEARIGFLREWNNVALIALFLIMFSFSYRKQTEYITKRIEAKK